MENQGKASEQQAKNGGVLGDHESKIIGAGFRQGVARGPLYF